MPHKTSDLHQILSNPMKAIHEGRKFLGHRLTAVLKSMSMNNAGTGGNVQTSRFTCLHESTKHTFQYAPGKLRAPNSQSQIVAIFCRKSTRRQPNRNGDALFFPRKSQKESQSLVIFRHKEKSQGFLGRKDTFRALEVAAIFSPESENRNRRKIATAPYRLFGGHVSPREACSPDSSKGSQQHNF